jgi:hypothetical protein
MQKKKYQDFNMPCKPPHRDQSSNNEKCDKRKKKKGEGLKKIFNYFFSFSSIKIKLMPLFFGYYLQNVHQLLPVFLIIRLIGKISQTMKTTTMMRKLFFNRVMMNNFKIHIQVYVHFLVLYVIMLI